MSHAAMSFAMVSTQADWGGGEAQAQLLARGLRDRGRRCTIFARRGGTFAARMAADGFEIVEFSGRGKSPAALRTMRRRLRELRPDALVYNDSPAVAAAGLASVGLRIPMRAAARRVAFPLRSAWPYRLFADRVLCVSHAAAGLCREGGVPAERIRVVHDGVDPARILSGDRERGRELLGVADDQAVILAVGKLTDCKGHTFLLYSLPQVFARHPRAVAAIVGDGELRDPLQSQAFRLGLGNRVRMLGYRSDVPDLIHAADLFVLPSHTEGLCSTLLDAMFAARPIVATTAGGIPDATGSGEPDVPPVAWSVPPRNAPALSRAMLDALDSPEERRRRGQRARRRAERLFTADRMVDATLTALGATAASCRAM